MAMMHAVMTMSMSMTAFAIAMHATMLSCCGLLHLRLGTCT
jgi:hypothetical protein